MVKIDEEDVEYSTRILEIRNTLFNGVNRAFSNQTGIAENTLSGLCNATAPVGLTNLLKILRNVPQVDARWLMTGEGEMLGGNGTTIVKDCNTTNKGYIHCNNIGGKVVNSLREVDGLITANKQQVENNKHQVEIIMQQSETIKMQSEQIGKLLDLLSKQE